MPVSSKTRWTARGPPRRARRLPALLARAWASRMQPSPDESRNSSRDRSRTSVSGHSASASARGPRPPAATSILERTAGEGVGRGEGLPSYKKRPFRRTPDAPRPLASAAWARLVLQTGLPDREDGGRVVGRATSSDPWPHLHNHWPLGPVGGVVGASARAAPATAAPGPPLTSDVARDSIAVPPDRPPQATPGVAIGGSGHRTLAAPRSWAEGLSPLMH